MGRSRPRTKKYPKSRNHKRSGSESSSESPTNSCSIQNQSTSSDSEYSDSSESHALWSKRIMKKRTKISFRQSPTSSSHESLDEFNESSSSRIGERDRNTLRSNQGSNSPASSSDGPFGNYSDDNNEQRNDMNDKLDKKTHGKVDRTERGDSDSLRMQSFDSNSNDSKVDNDNHSVDDSVGFRQSSISNSHESLDRLDKVNKSSNSIDESDSNLGNQLSASSSDDSEVEIDQYRIDKMIKKDFLHLDLSQTTSSKSHESVHSGRLDENKDESNFYRRSSSALNSDDDGHDVHHLVLKSSTSSIHESLDRIDEVNKSSSIRIDESGSDRNTLTRQSSACSSDNSEVEDDRIESEELYHIDLKRSPTSSCNESINRIDQVDKNNGGRIDESERNSLRRLSSASTLDDSKVDSDHNKTDESEINKIHNSVLSQSSTSSSNQLLDKNDEFDKTSSTSIDESEHNSNSLRKPSSSFTSDDSTVESLVSNAYDSFGQIINNNQFDKICEDKIDENKKNTIRSVGLSMPSLSFGSDNSADNRINKNEISDIFDSFGELSASPDPFDNIINIDKKLDNKSEDKHDNLSKFLFASSSNSVSNDNDRKVNERYESDIPFGFKKSITSVPNFSAERNSDNIEKGEKSNKDSFALQSSTSSSKDPFIRTNSNEDADKKDNLRTDEKNNRHGLKRQSSALDSVDLVDEEDTIGNNKTITDNISNIDITNRQSSQGHKHKKIDMDMLPDISKTSLQSVDKKPVIEEEISKRIDELVKVRVMEELEKRKCEIEQEIQKQVKKAKTLMLKDLERKPKVQKKKKTKLSKISRRSKQKSLSCKKTFCKKCPKCAKIFYQKKYLVQHIQFVHRKKVTCKNCNKHFFTPSKLRNHVCTTQIRKQTKNYNCEKCNGVFLQEMELKQHLESHKKEANSSSVANNSEPCSSRTCAQRENNISLIFDGFCRKTVHSNTNTMFTCQVCDRNFLDSESVKTHLLNIHFIIAKERSAQTFMQRTIRSASIIWQGTLKWSEKSENPNDSIRIVKWIPCQIFAKIKDGEPEVNVDGWQQTLIMQKYPKQLLQKMGSIFLRNAKSVLFQFTPGNELDSLTRILQSGHVGIVYVRYNSTPPYATSVMILMYEANRRAYIAFIPNDHAKFVNIIRKIQLAMQAKFMIQVNTNQATNAAQQLNQMNTVVLQSTHQDLVTPQTNAASVDEDENRQNVTPLGQPGAEFGQPEQELDQPGSAVQPGSSLENNEMIDDTEENTIQSENSVDQQEFNTNEIMEVVEQSELPRPEIGQLNQLPEQPGDLELQPHSSINVAEVSVQAGASVIQPANILEQPGPSTGGVVVQVEQPGTNITEQPGPSRGGVMAQVEQPALNIRAQPGFSRGEDMVQVEQPGINIVELPRPRRCGGVMVQVEHSGANIMEQPGTSRGEGPDEGVTHRNPQNQNAQLEPFEIQLQNERLQNLVRMNRLKETLETAQHEEQRYRKEVERINREINSMIEEALQAAQQAQMQREVIQQRFARQANPASPVVGVVTPNNS